MNIGLKMNKLCLLHVRAKNIFGHPAINHHIFWGKSIQHYRQSIDERVTKFVMVFFARHYAPVCADSNDVVFWNTEKTVVVG